MDENDGRAPGLVRLLDLVLFVLADECSVPARDHVPLPDREQVLCHGAGLAGGLVVVAQR